MRTQAIGSGLARSAKASGTPARGTHASIFRGLAGQLDMYRRYLRAGREIERLLGLTDAQLAALNLRRDDLGQKIFAKHGVGAEL